MHLKSDDLRKDIIVSVLVIFVALVIAIVVVPPG